MLHIKSKSNNNEQNIDFEDLKQRYDYIQSRLEKVRQLFDNETEKEYIESLIYEEKALMIRLDHLIRKMKELNK